MSIRKNILLISSLVGAIAFFAGIALLVASAIQDDLNVMPMFIGFAAMLICPVIGFILESKLNRPSPRPSDSVMSPAERMEGGTVMYCPLCHANLGASPSGKCPECGLRLR